MEELLEKGNICRMQPSQGMLFYLAGIIDGEGTVAVGKAGRDNIHYSIYVQIVNTNLELLEMIQDIFNGSLYGASTKYRVKAQEEGKNWKPMWILKWEGWKAKKLLEMLKEKIIVKAKQAEIVSLFPWNKEGEHQLFSDEDKSIREGLFNYCAKLNRKGIR